MTVKFLKLHEDAVIPTRGTALAAGLDLCCVEEFILNPGDIKLVPTGLAMELPPSHEGQVRPRSGLAAKHGVTVLNSPGTIDEDYRGEIKVILINHGLRTFIGHKGDRIAQLVVAKVVIPEVVETTELSGTQRGESGFGSTGR
jgi:dUTP pyrophosphatase